MKHIFVICAYKQSPYLEECIQSLKEQTIKSEIVLATSTPSDYLQELCQRYQIAYQVRNGSSGIAQDWNFALQCGHASYITIVHQDDIYYPDYAKDIVELMEKADKPLIAFTDYAEYKNGRECRTGLNLRIKRLLLHPLKSQSRSGSRFWRRWVLRYGNAICCPSVTYNKTVIGEYMDAEQRDHLFLQHFRSNLDWETWEWLSRREGQFLYLPKIRMAHRIHEDSETTATIQEHQRNGEDYEMFCKFWPRWIARLLTGWYANSEKSNEV